MRQNILSFSTENSIVQQIKVQSQTSQWTHIFFPQEKFFAIPLSGNMVLNRSLLFELELNEYFDITTFKAQIISAFVTSYLLVPTLIVLCFEDDASLESLTLLINNIEALDEGSIRSKNETGLSFGNLSSYLVPSAWGKSAVLPCNPIDRSLAQTLHLAL